MPISLNYYHCGSILIEFAFSIPILIFILFFINDHYRFYELKDKIRSSAYMLAGMIQQIGNTRAEKQITIDDFARMTYASCLNLFHTDTMFSHKFGIYYIVYFFYVKRLNSNKYQYHSGYATTSKKLGVDLLSGINRISNSEIDTFSSTYIKSIHPDLICDQDGDERVLLECFYHDYSFNKPKLNLLLLEPKWGTASRTAHNDRGNFCYKLVITPKPGLFPIKSE